MVRVTRWVKYLDICSTGWIPDDANDLIKFDDNEQVVDVDLISYNMLAGTVKSVTGLLFSRGHRCPECSSRYSIVRGKR